MGRLRVVIRRLWRLRPSGRVARVVAPAAFLLAVTGIVLLVRSTLRTTTHDSRTVSTPVVTRAKRTTRAIPPAAVGRYYVVAPGDTLGAIAGRFSTTVDELLRLNPDVQPTSLHPGDRIRVR